MANKNTTDFKQGLMDICSTSVTHTQATKLMQPTQDALDNPTENAEAACCKKLQISTKTA
jgi:hypothetical protein